MTIKDCTEVFEAYAEICIVKVSTGNVLFEGYVIDLFEKPEILTVRVYQIKARNDIVIFYV